MIAACAVGAFPHMNAAIAKWAAPPQAPDSWFARIYDEKYAAYAMGRHALEPVWDRRANAAGGGAMKSRVWA